MVARPTPILIGKRRIKSVGKTTDSADGTRPGQPRRVFHADDRQVRDTSGGASVRPGGAPECSHGWSSPKANGTRGVRGYESTRPEGAAEPRLRQLPPPLPGRVPRRVGIHGLRFARLAAGGAPPVATILGPSGTVPTPPKLSRTDDRRAARAALAGKSIPRRRRYSSV